ncbi:MAG: hypothetical protein R3223_07305 [Longimicrobiales bacterium]|nr:hypothetical protein [Longimicrobiales bacterium]
MISSLVSLISKTTRGGTRLSTPASVLLGILSCIAILVPAGTEGIAAQEPVREVQVPVDSAGRVLEITPEIRGATGLFPDLDRFEVARLFLDQNGGWILEVSWREDGRLVRERRPMSEAGTRRLRQEIQSALTTLDGVRPVVRDGRGGLVWGSTGLGLAFYGWAVPYSLHIDDPRAAVATYLLTASASFYLPYRLTRDRSVTDAHRSLALWGATRGAAYGATLGFALGGRDDALDVADDQDDSRLALGLATLGSVGGGLLGFGLADRSGVDEGTADLWGTLTDFATVTGFGAAYVAGLYDEETEIGNDGFPVRREPSLLPGHLTALGASMAGFYGAWALAPRGTYSVGDVSVLRSAGLLGAQSLLPVANLLDSEGEKLHVVAGVLGAASGLWVGHRLLARQDFSAGDGLLVSAGHLAGGLLGAGLTYLVDPQTDRDALIYLTTTALGSAAGLALTYRALSGSGASASRAVRTDGRTRVAARDGIRISLNPAGLIPALAGVPDDATSVPSPLVTLRW